jgi:hypothetical protein
MDETEGDGRLERSRVAALTRSWQDVWPLAQEVRRLRALLDGRQS